MISISRKLTISIIAALIIVNLLMSVVMYFSAFDEIDEIYDENMAQIANIISHQSDHMQFPVRSEAAGRKGFHSETEFLIQIWRNEELVFTSLPVMTVPKQDFEGYKHGQYENHDWYFYVLHKDDLTIQVAQPWNQRLRLFLEIYLRILIPIILQIPILIFLTHSLVRKGLSPLARVAHSIQMRKPDYLEPIPLSDVPREISVLVDTLNTFLNRLSETLTMQRRFTADAAHELRTPLTAVRLQLDLLARARNDAEREEAMSVLSKGVDRSIHLVEQLLSLARQEPEALEQPWEAVNLGSLVTEAVRLNQPLANNRQTIISQTVADNVIITGQRHHLLTMIGNLVNNAIIYTPNGGKVTITLTDRTDHAQLDIADNGIGIAPSDQARIFDRFYRAANSSEKGSGLGLSIVKSVADRHGIKLSVHSEPGTPGTLFRLVFPKSKTV